MQSLVIASLEKQEYVQEELFKITGKELVNEKNPDTATFTFSTIDGQPVTNVKQWY